MDETIAAYEAGLKKVRKKIDNIMTAIEDGAYNKRLKERLDRYEIEEQAIQEALHNAILRKDTQLTFKKILKLFYREFGDLNDSKQRKKLLDLMVDKIYIYDDEIVVTYFFSEDKRRLTVKDTMEMIAGRKVIMDYINNHRFENEMSYEESKEYLGLNDDEEPPDFF